MEPFYQDNYRALYQKDCRDMSELDADSVDLLATDPPYGISFMGKDWDTFNEMVPPQGAYQHKKGFKKLPRQNTASMPEFFVPIWEECLRVLKPGAFAFVMCSPRADVMSKQICCLQDAGFIVNFTPIFWTYATGFPKAQNIGKAVDKRIGAGREVIGYGQRGRNLSRPKGHTGDMAIDELHQEPISPERTAPSSPQAKALDGSYGGFQPKPAVEVIIVAMKPLSEKTFVDQALKNGKGITWLDSVRIPGNVEATRFDPSKHKHEGWRMTATGKEAEEVSQLHSGRFPANLLVSDDVLNDGKDTKSGKDAVRRQEGMFVEHHLGGVGNLQVYHPDSGSFSRYFDLDAWWAKTFPFLIVPKASKSEKNMFLDMPRVVKSGLPLRDGSGDYVENKYGDGSKSTRRTRTKNYHPTVKPVKLMSYLITLGSREGDIVLDNFAGTGSTGVAASLLGRRCVMYETKKEYCEMAAGRCRQVPLGV